MFGIFNLLPCTKEDASAPVLRQRGGYCNPLPYTKEDKNWKKTMRTRSKLQPTSLHEGRLLPVFSHHKPVTDCNPLPYTKEDDAGVYDVVSSRDCNPLPYTKEDVITKLRDPRTRIATHFPTRRKTPFPAYFPGASEIATHFPTRRKTAKIKKTSPQLPNKPSLSLTN